jgi:hypothetical protein
MTRPKCRDKIAVLPCRVFFGGLGYPDKERAGGQRSVGSTIAGNMAEKPIRVRPALSPALTELARQLQAETPGFVPLRPGEHRTVDDYTVNHYWDGPKRKAKSKNGQ